VSVREWIIAQVVEEGKMIKGYFASVLEEWLRDSGVEGADGGKRRSREGLVDSNRVLLKPLASGHSCHGTSSVIVDFDCISSLSQALLAFEPQIAGICNS
jgi:hypothetical protein